VSQIPSFMYILRCNPRNYSDPAGPQAMCGSQEIRVRHEAVQSLADRQLAPQDAPDHNFDPIQRIRGLDPRCGPTVGSTISDE